MEEGLLDNAGYTADVSGYIQVVLYCYSFYVRIQNRINYIKTVKKSYYAAITYVLFTFFSTKAHNEGTYMNDM